MFKSKLGIFVVLAIASTQLVAGEYSNVKKIKEKQDGTFRVKCIDNTKGRIFFEETQLCVASKQNGKNFCNEGSNWTVEQAAEYICAESTSN